MKAAADAISVHNPPSVALDAEYQGILYSDGFGNVISTTGVLGKPCVLNQPCAGPDFDLVRSTLPPEVRNDQVLADWHTHGGGTKESFDRFSQQDIRATNFLGGEFPNFVGAFLGTPQGNLRFIPVGWQGPQAGILLRRVPMR